MKKMDKKAFTLIELLVVIAVIGILVLLGAPRFTGYTQKAELRRIQHDTKVMEQEIGTVPINGDDDFNRWENSSKDYLNQLAQDNELFEKEGHVDKDGEPIDGSYKVIPEKYKGKISTKLKGTFYANSDGKVYYEHGKGPRYSDEEIDDLIKNHNFIPIATADELDNIRINEERTYGKGTKWVGEYTGGLDKHYVQVLDIDLSGYSEDGWNPIGNAGEDWNPYNPTEISTSFKGTYDGGNYTITGLEVKGSDSESYQGLFGFTQGATIHNVRLIDDKVTGFQYVGGLVGYARSGTEIINSYTTGSVTGIDYVGGLVGDAWASTIENSYTTGSVKGTGGWGGGGWFGYAGGLVGKARSGTEIINSYSTGTVTGIDYVGGLVGEIADSTIENSYATSEVKGDVYVGGLVGYAISGTNKISTSYATGSVKGSGNNIGGLFGYAGNSIIENSYATGSVKGSGDSVGGLVGLARSGTEIINSYTTGSVIGSTYVGGLVGKLQNSITISNSYWDKDTTGQTSSYGGIGLTTDEMKNQATYPDGESGWDFTNIWEITPGKYPTLR